MTEEKPPRVVLNPRDGMSHVSVTINNRQFRMACEDGQEGLLSDLARDLDARIDGLRAKFGEIGDSRLIVMAALTVADELDEMAKRFKRLEQEFFAVQQAHAEAVARSKSTASVVAAALASAAERIEGVTRKLNDGMGGADAVARG